MCPTTTLLSGEKKMRKVMTTMVAIVVIAFGSGQTSAQDFGFAFPSNQGSQWRGRGPAANTMLQAAQPRVRASNMLALIHI